LPVLIVDDNATNRRILHEVLTSWRMRPVTVESGTAALAKLEDSLRAEQPFAGVLLDGHMPDMDGSSGAERSCRDARHAGLTEVSMTSGARPEAVGRCRKSGNSAYLSKPSKQSELFDVIISAIGQPVTERPTASRSCKIARFARRPLKVLIAED